jgi:hypothetical protein
MVAGTSLSLRTQVHDDYHLSELSLSVHDHLDAEEVAVTGALRQVTYFVLQ